MTMYIRVKRKNQTIFLYTDGNEKVADVKAKLAKINSEDKKGPDQMSLIFNDAHLEFFFGRLCCGCCAVP